MDFKSFNDSFCPVLTAGLKTLTKCHTNCAWYNPTAKTCDLSIIADLNLCDPDAVEYRKKNENAQ